MAADWSPLLSPAVHPNYLYQLLGMFTACPDFYTEFKKCMDKKIDSMPPEKSHTAAAATQSGSHTYASWQRQFELLGDIPNTSAAKNVLTLQNVVGMYTWVVSNYTNEDLREFLHLSTGSPFEWGRVDQAVRPATVAAAVMLFQDIFSIKTGRAPLQTQVQKMGGKALKSEIDDFVAFARKLSGKKSKAKPKLASTKGFGGGKKK